MKNQSNIEILLLQKPYVIVQTLFQEKSLDTITTLHRDIQDTIKSKTTELRRIFESKYVELINCSQLLQRLKGFASHIDQISDEMRHTLLECNHEQNILNKQLSPLRRAQKLIRKQNYLEAMMVAIKIDEQEEVTEILKLDIIDKLFRQLENNSIDRQKLHSYVVTLVSYLLTTHCSSDVNYQEQYSANLGILMGNYKDVNASHIETAVIVAIKSIFHIKIKSIKSANSIDKLKDFVSDLLLILDSMETQLQILSKSIHQRLPAYVTNQVPLHINAFKHLYKQYFGKLHQALAVAMISRQKDKISFNHKLYEQIFNDSKLLADFDKLETRLESQSKLRAILKDLFNDFYTQILDHLLKEWDIFTVFFNLVEGRKEIKLLPEFKKYYQDDFAAAVFKALLKYDIPQITTQLRWLFGKSSADNHPYMMKVLLEQVDENLQRSQQNLKFYINQLEEPHYKLKNIVAICLFKTNYDQNIDSVADISTELTRTMTRFSHLLDQCIDESIRMFVCDHKLQQDWHLDMFEEIMMEFVVADPLMKWELALQSITLRFLTAIENTLEGKKKQKLQYTIAFLHKNEPKISIYSCQLNFLPQYLFKITHQPDKFGAQLLQDLLEQNKSVKRTFKKRQTKVEARRDAFEIGDRDQIIKIASKSIYDIGNSLAGFITKMSK